MALQRTFFGALADGRIVEAIAIGTPGRVHARILTYGATLQSLCIPDRNGQFEDIVLGFGTIAGYEGHSDYFGATIGRFANRIAGGSFVLDGHFYTLAVNNPPNALHGGACGFDKVVWTIVSGDADRVTLRHISPDGAEGYPGRLTVQVTFAIGADASLTIAYAASTDAPTVVNLTNHSYWNLAGEASARSALGDRLMIAADAFTPVDAGLIPTGEVRQVAGTPFDFRRSTPIAARIGDTSDAQIGFGRGYDHNFILAGGVTTTPRLVARLEEPVSGRAMDILTTAPGLQFYSGNVLDGSAVGKGGRAYGRGDGLAFETQHFPDSPNQPLFPTTRLDPGQTWRQTTIYRFSVLR